MQLRALFDFNELLYCIYSILRSIIKYSIKRFIILFLIKELKRLCHIRKVSKLIEKQTIEFFNCTKYKSHRNIISMSLKLIKKSFLIINKKQSLI